MARKTGLGGLLLLGAAAFGVYKYSKMSDQQKRDLKDKGKRLVDENLGSLKNAFGRGQSENVSADRRNGNNFSQA